MLYFYHLYTPFVIAAERATDWHSEHGEHQREA